MVKTPVVPVFLGQWLVNCANRGEGEHTFKELVYFIDGNQENVKKKDIRGISYKNREGKVIHNADRPLEKNLDNFPLPRRDLLNKKKYNSLGARVMLMETSRGCPHSCKFCCIIQMWKDSEQKIVYRTKSLSRIMKELYTIDYKHWDFVFFGDDNFTIQVDRTKKILDMLIKSRLSKHLSFSCQSRVDTLYRNPWLLPLMKKANINNIFLGIESVHQESLDKMNKHIDIKMIQKAAQMCNDLGISIFGGIIIGYPGETKEMVRENIDFAVSLNMEFVQFTPITAFPGTKFFTEMQQKDLIATYDYKYYNLFHPMMSTEEIDFVEMYKLVAEAYATHYNNSRYIKSMLKRFFQNRYKWMRPLAFRWMRQFIGGGITMLHQNSISHRLVSNSENTEDKGTINIWKMKIMRHRT